MDTCALCRMKDVDNVRYGEIVKNKRMAVHTFCLYLSSNLKQSGEEDEGFFGFLEPDILKEIKRNSRLFCCYCSKANANIGCCVKKCRRCFHLICGIKHGAENQFVNTFKSFCHDHVRKISRGKPGRKEQCCICYDNLQSPGQRFCAVNMIRAPCCQNGWFHKVCLQTFANTAGYFFKCPLCNDKTEFCAQLPYRGIFIPERLIRVLLSTEIFSKRRKIYSTTEEKPETRDDAAWELEPNAFAELLERPSSCAAEPCKCSAGRERSSNKNPLLFCNACGSIAMHKQCLANDITENSFYCTDCNIAIANANELKNPVTTNNTEVEEVADVDICNISADSDSDKDDSKNVDCDLNTSNEDFVVIRRNIYKFNGKIEDGSDEDAITITDSEDEQNAIARKKVNISESSSDEFESLNSVPTLNTSFNTQEDDKSGDEAESVKGSNKNCIAGKDFSASENVRTVNVVSPIPTNIMNADFVCKPKPSSLDNSCIAHRTRRKSIMIEANSTQTSLDNSCIAYRTRRKSIMIEANSTQTASQTEEKSSSLDISCVAKRRRRQSSNYHYNFTDSSETTTSSPAENQTYPGIDDTYNSQTCSTDSRRNSHASQTINTSCVARPARKLQSTRVTETQIVDLNDNTSKTYAASSSDAEFASISTETTSSNPSFKSFYKSLESSLSDEGATCSASSQSRQTCRVKVLKKRANTRRLLSTDDENFESACESRVQRNFRMEVAKCPMRARHTNLDPYITPLFKLINGKLKRVDSMDSTQNKDKRRVPRRCNFFGGPSNWS